VPFADINDASIYYETHGEGECLLFAHGGDGTHLGWWRQAYFFRNYYKCLIYDMRGLGQSTGAVNYEEGWRDLLGLMDHLEIENAHINGWSAGEWTVSKIAQDHPERVRSLIMTDAPFGFFTPALSKWSQGMIDQLTGGSTIRGMAGGAYFADHYPKDVFLSGLLGRLNEHNRPASSEEALQDYGKAYREWRDAEPGDYSDFPVPSLFVVGETDGLTVPWLMRGTAERVRGAKLAVIPRAGHGTPREQTEIYNALLLEFLQTVDQQRRDPTYVPPKWSLVEYFHGLSGIA